MRLKTLNQKMEYLRNGVRYCLLLILLVLAFATGAHAAQDDYYYPNYDAVSPVLGFGGLAHIAFRS